MGGNRIRGEMKREETRVRQEKKRNATKRKESEINKYLETLQKKSQRKKKEKENFGINNPKAKVES